MITSTEIIERNKKREKAVDEFGRTFEVRRLPLGEQLRVLGMAGEQGRTIGDALVLAASVTSVNGDMMTMPRDMNDLFDRLNIYGEEGIRAVGDALKKLSVGELESAEDTIDAAKN